MDKKDTTKPSAVGNADGDIKSSPQEPSLGHQAFDVFKDVLVSDIVKESRRLRDENKNLDPVDNMINSSVTVILAGKRYFFELRNGRRVGNRLLFSVQNADTILLKDLTGHDLFGQFFGSDDDETPHQVSPQGPKLFVALGKIELGSLSLASAFEGGDVKAKRVFDKSGEENNPYLNIWPSSKATVGGRLGNVSEEDLSDNFQFFNRQASARIMFGLPAEIRNEDNVSFTMDLVTIKMTPELEDTVDVLLQNHDNDLLKAPELILSNLVADVFEDDKSLSQKVEEYMVQKADNVKMMSVRERLGTIDIRYQGGSRRFSLDECILKKSEKNVVVNFPRGPDDPNRIKFNQLREMHVTLSGLDLSTNHSRFPRFANERSAVIAIPIGPETKVVGVVELDGVEGGWANFSFPDNSHPHDALRRALNGQSTLPDTVMFRFLAVQFDCSRPSSRIVQTLKALGKWQDGVGLEDSNLDGAQSDDSS